MQFARLTHVLDTLKVLVDTFLGLEVGVTITVFNGVTHFAAAEALLVSFKFFLLLCLLSGVVHFIVIIVLTLMLAEFAAWLVLAPLTTTPPHLPAPFRLMDPTRPIEVLFLVVLLVAVLARFDRRVKLTFLLYQARHILLKFFSLFLQILLFPFQLRRNFL